jgi:hypothetical protein
MVSNIDSNFAEYSTFKVLPRYGPLRQIWLRDGPLQRSSALWTIAASLVMHYGPLPRTGYMLLATAVSSYTLWDTGSNDYELWVLRGIKQSVTISALWATAQDFAMGYGHSAGFGDVL